VEGAVSRNQRDERSGFFGSMRGELMDRGGDMLETREKGNKGDITD
jgi:hypothetical protein